MAFTASERPALLVAIDEAFGEDTMLSAEINHPVQATKAVLENQTIRTEPLSRNGECVGVTAYYAASGIDPTTEGYYDTTANTALGCDVLDGNEIQTLSKDYANNVFFQTPFKIEEERCNNLLTRATEFALAINVAANTNRMKLNERIITTLAANVQPNQWVNSPAALTDVVASNRLGFPEASTNADGLRLLELAAQANQLGMPIIIDGTNFYTDHDLAMFKALNDNGRSGNAIYNASRLYHDILDLPKILGRNSTFAVNPGVPIFRAFTNYENVTPIQISSKDDHWVFRMPDPVLSYRDNGQLVPLYQEVEYKRNCLRRNAAGKLEYGWSGMVSLRGLFDIAPAGFTNAIYTGDDPVQSLTGIMEFEAIAPSE